MDTTAFFVAAMFAYYTYARFYYQWNEHNDKYQLPILIVAAFVGLVPALILNTGILISVFCVTPKVAISGLLVSDLLHLAYQGPWQKETKKERVTDEEKGSHSDADQGEKCVCVDEEEDSRAVLHSDAAEDQRPVAEERY